MGIKKSGVFPLEQEEISGGRRQRLLKNLKFFSPERENPPNVALTPDRDGSMKMAF